jgi:DUF4097 and DUF4098 domain-containing protein YvlB
LFILSALAGCLSTDDNVTEDFNGSYDAPPGTVLTVESINGYVEIEATVGGSIVLDATKHSGKGEEGLDRIHIDVTEEPGHVTIKARIEGNQDNLGVRMKLKVPAGVHVDDVETSNGRIELRGTVGNTTLKSSNGEVEVQNVDGFVKVTTSNSGISVSSTDGILDLKTSNGPIEAEIDALAGDTDVETSNGPITLHINEDLDVHITVSTSNGDVTVHDDLVTDTDSSDQRLDGTLGTGAISLRIDTDNADVDIHKL